MNRDLLYQASCVGLAYLKLAYKHDSRNPHYTKVKRRMKKQLGGKKNVMMGLVARRNACYLHSNLPRMQYLLNVAIGRSPFSVRRVKKALRYLRM